MIAINNISENHASSQILWELDLQTSTSSSTYSIARTGTIYLGEGQ